MQIPAIRVLCTRKQLVNSMSQHIIGDGGEGVILREPKSLYKHGRSESLLKLKVRCIVKKREESPVLCHYMILILFALLCLLFLFAPTQIIILTPDLPRR